ncbi:MAG: BspA family leucine-rich repeat surface protein, partial [Pseudomonadota bacterium]
MEFGHISTWNTGCVTDMSGLFSWQIGFNDDISGWDTSSVTN